MPTNFQFAPPSKIVDGLTAVPIDIQNISASFVFDAATSSATADATIDFIMGPQNGNAIFDLRQTISAAWLDGVSIAVSKLASHDFGGGSDAQLRVIESALVANSSHSLRVTYSLGLPQSPLGIGSNTPHLTFSAGPRLTFNFGFTDLAAARYIEGWLPANLIFDQFALNLEIQLLNTSIVHTLITNGTITTIGTHHWSIVFPDRFTALSTLVEIRANDSFELQTGTVTLPVSGNVVTIEAYKPAGGSVNLTAEINNIKSFLTDNENSYGKYIHGNRFIALYFLATPGGMEYEGAAAVIPGTALHETFHSWFARGLKPASQPDGWWDEAYTTYHEHGESASVAFDFTAAPVTLCPQNPWVRITAGGSYVQGEQFFKGVSALIGNSNLRALMKSLYNDTYAQLLRTTDLEEYLVSKSGNETLVDAFHRFIYGLPDPSPAPDVWIKDDVSDPGDDYWAGRFWDSPDLWIRNADDGNTTHQNPEYGQDNWFYARIRNRSSSAVAKHFLVSFNAKSFAGTEFLYPADFLPSINAATGFELAAGGSTVVKAKWFKDQVPPAGTHSCMLAAVIARSAHPVSGKHVWEHNNLAQKNLTIVDLVAGDFIILPFVISNFFAKKKRKFRIEVLKEKIFPFDALKIIHNPGVFAIHKKMESESLRDVFSIRPSKDVILDCGGHISTSGMPYNEVVTSANVEFFARMNSGAIISSFKGKKIPALTMQLKPRDQLLLALKVQVPKDSKPGSVHRLDVVQRDDRSNRIIGGVALEIRVKTSLEIQETQNIKNKLQQK